MAAVIQFCVFLVSLITYIAAEKSYIHSRRTLRRTFWALIAVSFTGWMLALLHAVESLSSWLVLLAVAMASSMEDSYQQKRSLTPLTVQHPPELEVSPEAQGEADAVADCVRSLSRWYGETMGLRQAITRVWGTLSRRRSQLFNTLLSTSAEELNYILGTVNCAAMLDVAGAQVLHLLSSPSCRLKELSVFSRAAVVDALQKIGLRYRPERQQAVANIMLGTTGLDLTQLKSYLDEGGQEGSHHTTFKLVYSDLQGDVQQAVAMHITNEGIAVREELLRALGPRQVSCPAGVMLKVLSDIDDTLHCSGGIYPAGIDTRYPKKCVYPGVLTFYHELDRAHVRRCRLALGISQDDDSDEEQVEEEEEWEETQGRHREGTAAAAGGAQHATGMARARAAIARAEDLDRDTSGSLQAGGIGLGAGLLPGDRGTRGAVAAADANEGEPEVDSACARNSSQPTTAGAAAPSPFPPPAATAAAGAREGGQGGEEDVREGDGGGEAEGLPERSAMSIEDLPIPEWAADFDYEDHAPVLRGRNASVDPITAATMAAAAARSLGGEMSGGERGSPRAASSGSPGSLSPTFGGRGDGRGGGERWGASPPSSFSASPRDSGGGARHRTVRFYDADGGGAGSPVGGEGGKGARGKFAEALAAFLRANHQSGINLAFLTARPQMFKGYTESRSYQKIFAPLLSKKQGLRHMPILLLGDMSSAPVAIASYVRKSFFGSSGVGQSTARGGGSGSKQCVGSDAVPQQPVYYGTLNAQLYQQLARRKLARFKEYAAIYPECCFIFIGDNGQGDVLCAEWMAHTYEGAHGMVLATFVHQVDRPCCTLSNCNTGAESDAELLQRWASEYSVHCSITYIGLATAAARQQLLGPRGLYRVAAASCADLRRLLARYQPQFPWRDWSLIVEQHNHDLEQANQMLPQRLRLPPLQPPKPPTY